LHHLNHENNSKVLIKLGIESFQERFPWIGADLQTLRDSFPSEKLYLGKNNIVEISVPSMPGRVNTQGKLMAILNLPKSYIDASGLVLILHGLGGSSKRHGLCRMSKSLLDAGFAVLRLNLRGASPGRHLAPGTYSAKCSTDLFPVFNFASDFLSLHSKNKLSSKKIPFYGVGISLGGTILLNACLDKENSNSFSLDGLVCTSSPLDLEECSKSIERNRNLIYQNWLLNRLVSQTLSDPFECEAKEYYNLRSGFVSSIRDFDELITAPRWGYNSVQEYYIQASPLTKLAQNSSRLPPSIFLQSYDDPWVPVGSTYALKDILDRDKIKTSDIVITDKGGHNGFHGKNGCWGDDLVCSWLKKHSASLINHS
tara:strand:+ start:87 stop:1193 length:1107 start_codon:yes stop_codon:yes gene_type:complete